MLYVFVLQLKDEQFELRTLVSEMSEQLIQLKAQLPKPKAAKPKKLSKKAQAELDAAMNTALTTALATDTTAAAAPAAAAVIKPATTGTAATAAAGMRPRQGPGRPRKDSTISSSSGAVAATVKKPLAKKISEVPMNTSMRNALQIADNQQPLKAPVRRPSNAETQASILERRRLGARNSVNIDIGSSIAQANTATTTAAAETVVTTDSAEDSSNDAAAAAAVVAVDDTVENSNASEEAIADASTSTTTVNVDETH
jgi:hypothetical protein